MRIAIVHFHLQTGGVTRVIQHACGALTAAGHRVAVLCGEAPQQSVGDDVPVRVLAALDYEERRAPAGPSELAAALRDAAREALGGPPDVWHIHNHCLGKNLALPGAVRQLAESGAHLLLQPHDFAEDGRPALYRRMLETIGHQNGADLAALLYPLAPQIHYAVLNSRDHGFLARAGVPASRLHLLPNAVCIGVASPSPVARKPEGTRLWLYPTRAIRRKNVGELLLWAALGAAEDRFATTQAPQNPAELPRYRRWVALAEELGLPVEFGLGDGCEDFAALLASSHALITTSVGEGFGLAFLEPWLIGRPLAGRDLPEITADFRAQGIRLDDLYQRLLVPVQWIDAERLRAELAAALERQALAYGRPLPPDAVQRAWDAAVSDDYIDVGRLDEQAQESVIRRLQADPLARSAMPTSVLAASTDPELIAANRAAVIEHYDLASYGRRLQRLYTDLVESEPSARLEHANGDILFDQFSDPARLRLLRT
jgi:glycosyltransferase involved in cell wall biosynthesis